MTQPVETEQRRGTESCPNFPDLVAGHQDGRWVVKSRNKPINSTGILKALAADTGYEWKRASTPTVQVSKKPFPEKPPIGPVIRPLSIRCIYEKHLRLEDLPTENRLKGVTGGTSIITIDFPKNRQPVIDLTWQNNDWAVSHNTMIADTFSDNRDELPKAYRSYFLTLSCSTSREACWFKTER